MRRGQCSYLAQNQLENENVDHCVLELGLEHGWPQVHARQVQKQYGRCEIVVRCVPANQERLSSHPEPVIDDHEHHAEYSLH